MVIGIDASRTVTNKRTGTEGYAYHLIRALIPLANERGYTIKLYYNTSPPSPLSPSPHLPISLPAPRLWTHTRLAVELHRNPPDVFFTPAHVIPFSYRGASVATIHDLGYEYFPAAHPTRQRLYLRWSTRHNARRSRHILADSHATKADLIRLYGVDRGKITVVYPSVDDQLQKVADPNPTLKKYGIITPYLLYIGTLQPRKNLVRVVEAFAQIANTIPHHLVLAGKQGWLSEPILTTISNLKSQVLNRIHITGFVPEADKAALLSGATALVFPSLFEGFGFPVLEAQRCDLPVLTARNSSLPEVAGEAALFVNEHDVASIAEGMVRIVRDDVLRRELIDGGKENVKRFDWGISAEITLNILERSHK